jgi:gamma-glutamyltranspeptidase/glutathione hydrolase
MIHNILVRFPTDGGPLSPDRLHVEMEATRLAYAEGHAHLDEKVRTSLSAAHYL